MQWWYIYIYVKKFCVLYNWRLSKVISLLTLVLSFFRSSSMFSMHCHEQGNTLLMHVCTTQIPCTSCTPVRCRLSCNSRCAYHFLILYIAGDISGISPLGVKKSLSCVDWCMEAICYTNPTWGSYAGVGNVRNPVCLSWTIPSSVATPFFHLLFDPSLIRWSSNIHCRIKCEQSNTNLLR